MDTVRGIKIGHFVQSNDSHHSVLGWTVTAALLIHWLVSLVHISDTDLVANGNSLSEPIIVEDYSSGVRKPVVKTSRVAPDEATTESPAFYSDTRNRVAKQTRAPLVGK